jgi:hypothetical protein
LTLFLKVLEKQQEASISTGLFAQKMGKNGGRQTRRQGVAGERILPGTNHIGSNRAVPEKSV